MILSYDEVKNLQIAVRWVAFCKEHNPPPSKHDLKERVTMLGEARDIGELLYQKLLDIKPPKDAKEVAVYVKLFGVCGDVYSEANGLIGQLTN
jgi:hypothetical protein